MVTDNQRREVAKKMREYDVAEFKESAIIPFLECLGHGYTDWQGILDELADLIEPQPIDGNTSDGYHTFNELYHHRAVLFSVIVENFANRAWKSKLHADGTMYEGMFIVGIETPDGQSTYHYDVVPYWNLFRCKEVDRAPEWDGHTPDQAIERIGKLVDCKTDRPTCHVTSRPGNDETDVCDSCSACSFGWHRSRFDQPYHYCPNCGAEVLDEDGAN